MENLLLLRCIFEKEKAKYKIGIVIFSVFLLFCVILNLVGKF